MKEVHGGMFIFLSLRIFPVSFVIDCCLETIPRRQFLCTRIAPGGQIPYKILLRIRPATDILSAVYLLWPDTWLKRIEVLDLEEYGDDIGRASEMLLEKRLREERDGF